MSNYRFGNVDIEFHTNKIFLLMQMLYRMDNIENTINSDDRVSYLKSYLENFKKVMESHKEGLEEFTSFKDNAESKNMWAEYGEYIERFAHMEIEELHKNNPSMAKVVEELLHTDLFSEVERLNDKYTNIMENKFKAQTEPYKKEADNIVGKTKNTKIIFMPFTPDLFSMEPCCLSDKN